MAKEWVFVEGSSNAHSNDIEGVHFPSLGS